MNEIEEIIDWKDNDQLIKELNFQLKQWETLWWTICSEVLHNIKGDLWLDETNNLVTKEENNLFKKIN